MRVAIANWNRRIAGGSETYLKTAIGGLERAGIECALLNEIDEPADRDALQPSTGAPRFCIGEVGATRALDALRAWSPDLVFVHILKDPKLEAKLLELAPGVLFAHSHQGMCISGEKTFKFPEVRPCGRRFGWQCIVQFYPHRCGGLNPLTMWRDYKTQSLRHSMLSSYSAIVTASKYLARELEKHGIVPERIHTIPMPMNEVLPRRDRSSSNGRATWNGVPRTWRLLFVGRLARLKGVGTLLDALPIATAALGAQIEVAFVGDGPNRSAWEDQARIVESRDRRVSVRFAGWMNAAELEALYEQTDLIVVPSLGPETFGLAGLEAGRAGVPAAAFDVGGISEWLIDGINGFLAAGDPPRAQGLADTIVRCLREPETYERLCRGASETSRRFNLATHIESLLAIFDRVAGYPNHQPARFVTR